MAPGRVGPDCSSGPARRLARAAGAVGRQPGHRGLHADVPVAEGHALARAVFDFLEVASVGVVVARGAEAALAAEQLVDGHAGPLALDVPERDVHAAHRVEQHRAVAPVGADVGGLPDVLDLVDVAADEERLQVLLDGRLHDVGALRERGAAQAVEARLARLHLHHHQPDAVGRREDRLDVADLDGGRPFVAAAACVTPRLPRRLACSTAPSRPPRVPADSICNASRRSMSVSSGARVTEARNRPKETEDRNFLTTRVVN